MTVRRSVYPALCLLTMILLPLAAAAQPGQDNAPKLPWTVAFLREGNLWLMNGDGSNQRKWKTFGNAMGLPSWAPDGKRLVFTRRGDYTYNLPDGGGGTHRLYDVFASHIDSARDGFWWWITLNHGSRAPEWGPNGKYIIYSRDLNANRVDAELPRYGVEYRTFDGSEVVRLFCEDAPPGACQGLEPTWSPDGQQIAFIYGKMKTPSGSGAGGGVETVGLVVVPAAGVGDPRPYMEGITIAPGNYVVTDEWVSVSCGPHEALEERARQIPYVAGPAWSPDGEWIAYVDTRSSDGGIYLVSPDGKTKQRIFEPTSRIIPYRGKLSWSPDSQWLAFASTTGYIYFVDRDGARPPYRMTSNGNDYYPSFSPK